MKKLLVVTLILSMAVVANARLVISIDGVTNPGDSTIYITEPSKTVIVDIHSIDNPNPGVFSLGIGTASGPGSLDVSGLVTFQGVTAAMKDDAIKAEAFGIQNPFISLELGSQLGLLADGILFHCNGPGDVTLYIFDDNGLIADSQVIHQVPEPMTVALLGLGGVLFLRRKNA